MPLPSLVAVIREIIAEPLVGFIWWYGPGAGRALERLQVRLREGNEYLGWSVWLRSLFTPMYGQYDAVGRVISFGIRALQIIVSSVAMFVWAAVSCLLYVLYLFAPILVVAMIAYQVTGLDFDV